MSKNTKKSTKGNRWIYLPIESKNRELHSRILIGIEGAKRGYKVVIAGKNKLRKILKNYPPGLVFFKDHASDSTNKFMREAKDKRHQIALLDEESFVLHPDEIFTKVRVNKPATEMIDHAFFLGDRHINLYKRIKALSLLNSYSISGNPRFDLTRPNLRENYRNDVLRLKKKYGKFILINTHFAQGNHADGSGGFLWRVKKNGFFNDPEIKNYYTEMSNERAKLFKHYKEEVIPTLASNFPDLKIIIRTHPEENDKTYKAISKVFKNVVVIHEGSVHPWILASESVIHSGCTTGTEAFALGKKSIFYNPLDVKYIGISNIEINNKFKLIEALKNDIKLDQKKNNELFTLKDAIANYDDSYAYISILDTIDKMPLDNYVKFKSNLSLLMSIRHFILEELTYLIRDIRYFFDKKNMARSGRKKFNKLRSSEVKRILHPLAICINANVDLSVKNIGPDSVLIFKD